MLPAGHAPIADVFYYFKGKQVYSYNQNTNVSTALGPQLPYDQVFYKGEDDICFDGDHRIGFGKRGSLYYIYVFSVSTGTVVSEYLIGNSSDYANIDSAEIAPNDVVIVSFIANDRNDTKSFNKGVWAFTIDMHPLWQLYSAPGHHDLGRDVDGTPVLVITNSGNFHPLAGCQNGIEKISIPNPAARQCLLSLHWTLAVHVSMADNCRVGTRLDIRAVRSLVRFHEPQTGTLSEAHLFPCAVDSRPECGT